jgi:hypothetical protein
VVCRVVAHYGSIFVFEDAEPTHHIFKSIEEFRTRFDVFSIEVQVIQG